MYLLVEQVHPLFCGDDLCAVMFLANPLDLTRGAASVLTTLHAGLGVPQADPVPPECTRDPATLAECVRSGKAVIRQVWKATDGLHVMLVIDGTAPHPIRLTYATERAIERLNRAGAALDP
jgi:hypothetical protein